MKYQNGFSIRAAVASDSKAILGFIRELAEFERLSDQVTATESALESTLFGTNPAAEVLIAEKDGIAVGFALFFISYSTFLSKPGLYLEDLYVQPAHRRLGIGRALLSQLAGVAVIRNYGRMEWSVLDWNEGAIRLYRSLGAEPMSEWTVQRLAGDALKRLAAELPG